MEFTSIFTWVFNSGFFWHFCFGCVKNRWSRASHSKEQWVGVGLIAFGISASACTPLGMSLFTVDYITLLPCLMGVFVYDWRISEPCDGHGPPLALLGFMYPWPGWLVDNIMRPLKRGGTWFAEFTLQTSRVLMPTPKAMSSTSKPARSRLRMHVAAFENANHLHGVGSCDGDHHA